jgi:hypothetical protein
MVKGSPPNSSSADLGRRSMTSGGSSRKVGHRVVALAPAELGIFFPPGGVGVEEIACLARELPHLVGHRLSSRSAELTRIHLTL